MKKNFGAYITELLDLIKKNPLMFVPGAIVGGAFGLIVGIVNLLFRVRAVSAYTPNSLDDIINGVTNVLTQSVGSLLIKSIISAAILSAVTVIGYLIILALLYGVSEAILFHNTKVNVDFNKYMEFLKQNIKKFIPLWLIFAVLYIAVELTSSFSILSVYSLFISGGLKALTLLTGILAFLLSLAMGCYTFLALNALPISKYENLKPFDALKIAFARMKKSFWQIVGLYVVIGFAIGVVIGICTAIFSWVPVLGSIVILGVTSGLMVLMTLFSLMVYRDTKN